MLYANVDGCRARPCRGARGECPNCDGEVVARCGDVNIWHWAHVQRLDCDSWSEGESEWHLGWKRRFPKRWREFVVGTHRADVKSPRGVIELQASSISAAEIAEREEFYGEMVWLLDAREFDLPLRDHSSHVTFRWKHPRRTWWCADKPLFLDVGNGRMVEIRKLHAGPRCAGWGTFLTYKEFVERFSAPNRGQELCERCKMTFPVRELTKTGMYEYYTMDLDPETVLCGECYEIHRDEHIPEDPSCWDCYTPVAASGVWRGKRDAAHQLCQGNCG